MDNGQKPTGYPPDPTPQPNPAPTPPPPLNTPNTQTEPKVFSSAAPTAPVDGGTVTGQMPPSPVTASYKKPLIIGIAALLIIAGGAAAYLFLVQDKTTNPKTTSNISTSLNSSAHSADPTADWTPYTNASGKYSLKYPKTWVQPSDASECGEFYLLLGANQQSAGMCSSATFGQITITQGKGDSGADATLTEESYSNITKESFTVDGVTGQKESGTVTNSETAGIPVPVGTKVVEYYFYKNGITYLQFYTQEPGMLDVLSDFNLMVTKTLKFNP